MLTASLLSAASADGPDRVLSQGLTTFFPGLRLSISRRQVPCRAGHQRSASPWRCSPAETALPEVSAPSCLTCVAPQLTKSGIYLLGCLFYDHSMSKQGGVVTLRSGRTTSAKIALVSFVVVLWVVITVSASVAGFFPAQGSSGWYFPWAGPERQWAAYLTTGLFFLLALMSLHRVFRTLRSGAYLEGSTLVVQEGFRTHRCDLATAVVYFVAAKQPAPIEGLGSSGVPRLLAIDIERGKLLELPLQQVGMMGVVNRPPHDLNALADAISGEKRPVADEALDTVAALQQLATSSVPSNTER